MAGATNHLSVGDKVTTTERVAAFYSGYAGRRECFFEPGDVGEVKHVNSPSVRYGPGKRDLQTVVEFTKHSATQTVRLWNFQVQKLRGKAAA
jgi:hypothetical protein